MGMREYKPEGEHQGMHGVTERHQRTPKQQPENKRKTTKGPRLSILLIILFILFKVFETGELVEVNDRLVFLVLVQRR